MSKNKPAKFFLGGWSARPNVTKEDIAVIDEFRRAKRNATRRRCGQPKPPHGGKVA